MLGEQPSKRAGPQQFRPAVRFRLVARGTGELREQTRSSAPASAWGTTGFRNANCSRTPDAIRCSSPTSSLRAPNILPRGSQRARTFGFPANLLGLGYLRTGDTSPERRSPYREYDGPRNPDPYVYRYSTEAEYQLGPGWWPRSGIRAAGGAFSARPVHITCPSTNPHIGQVNILLTDAYTNFNALLTRLHAGASQQLQLDTDYRFARASIRPRSIRRLPSDLPFDQPGMGPVGLRRESLFTLFGAWDLPLFRDRSSRSACSSAAGRSAAS